MTQGIEFGENGMPFEDVPQAAALAEGAKPDASPRVPDAQGAAEDQPEAKAADEMPFAVEPEGPWSYSLGTLTGKQATDEDIGDIRSVAQSLYEARVPEFAVNVVQEAARRNLSAGVPSDATLAMLDTSCRATLELRHGAEGAKALIADANKVVQRLAGNPMIAHYLDATGAGSDPHVVETLARVERNYYAKRG